MGNTDWVQSCHSIVDETEFYLSHSDFTKISSLAVYNSYGFPQKRETPAPQTHAWQWWTKPLCGASPSKTNLWESKHNFTNGAGELLYIEFVSLKLVELTLNRTTVTVTTFGSDNLGFKWTQIK